MNIDVSTKTKALAFFRVLTVDSAKLISFKYTPKIVDAEFSTKNSKRYNIVLENREQARETISSIVNDMKKRFGDKESSQQEPWNEVYRFPYNISTGIVEHKDLGGYNLFLYSKGDADDRELQEVVRQILLRLESPEIKINKEIEEYSSTYKPTLLGVVVCAIVLLIMGLLVLQARDPVYAIARFDIPISNVITGSIFILMSICALLRKISFTYFYLLFSSFIIMLQLLFVKNVAESEVCMINLLASIFLLIFIPIRRKDFGFESLESFFKKFTEYF